jgi:hypothetical protein
MKAFLAQLDDSKNRTVGDLIAFMHVYNLRFGPATSDRQTEIYSRLVPALTAIRDEPANEKAQASAPDYTGQGLRAAAKSAFKWMNWGDLEAHRNTR